MFYEQNVHKNQGVIPIFEASGMAIVSVEYTVVPLLIAADGRARTEIVINKNLFLKI